MRYCSGSKHNRVSGINKQSSWANDFTWHHGDTDIRLRVMGNSWNDTMTTFSPQYRPYWNKLYCKTIMVLHCNFKWNDTQNPIKKLALARSEHWTMGNSGHFILFESRSLIKTSISPFISYQLIRDCTIQDCWRAGACPSCWGVRGGLYPG